MPTKFLFSPMIESHSHFFCAWISSISDSYREGRRKSKKHFTRQHLLWMGFDRLLTLLLFDWTGTNITEGVGAMFNCSRSSSTSTLFRNRGFLRNLRARSMLLRLETCSGWLNRYPIKTRKLIILQVGLFIFNVSTLQQQDWIRLSSAFVQENKMRVSAIFICSLFLMPCPCTYKPMFHLDLEN